MTTRPATIVGAVVLLLAAGGLGWILLGQASAPAADEAAPAQAAPADAASAPVAPADAAPAAVARREPLPVPPVPPRVAEGARYEQCLAMVPDDPRGAVSFAEGWTDGGEGATHCRAMAEVSLGNVETGAKLLERIAADSHVAPAARAAVYGQAAQAWLMAGNAANAFRAGTAALALTPDDADMLVDRAVAAGSLNRFEDAQDDLTHALDVDPHRAETLVLRASAWRHLGQLDLAQDDIDRALTIDPDNAEALLERGILRERRNDWDGARSDWEQAIALAPDSATADLAEQNLALLEAGPASK